MGGLKGLFTRGAGEVAEAAATKTHPKAVTDMTAAIRARQAAGIPAGVSRTAAPQPTRSLDDYLRWQQAQPVATQVRASTPGRLRGGEWIEGGTSVQTVMRPPARPRF